jgi:hypothetical protein
LFNLKKYNSQDKSSTPSIHRSFFSFLMIVWTGQDTPAERQNGTPENWGDKLSERPKDRKTERPGEQQPKKEKIQIELTV